MNKTFKATNSNKIFKYYLINKFFYKTTKKLPYMKKLVVNCNQKTTEIKQVAMSNLALEVLFSKKSTILVTKKPNLLLKTKKNQPVGCKLILNNKILILQALKTIFNILETNEYNIDFKTKRRNSVTIDIPEVFNCERLEKFFFIFYKLKNLNISFTSNFSNYKNNKEINFLISYCLFFRV